MIFYWIKKVGLYNLVFEIRQVIYPVKNILPEWFLFSLPDALWIYSFTFFMLLIWGNSKRIEKYFWIPLGIFLGIGSELLQFIKIIPGKFDANDLLLCIIFSGVPFIVIKYEFRRINNEKVG